MHVYAWHDQDQENYHELQIRREGSSLIISEYVSRDAEDLGDEAFKVEEREPDLDELQLAAAHLFDLGCLNHQVTRDGITAMELLDLTPGEQFPQVKYSFTDERGRELTEKELYDLVVRYLVV